MQLQGSDFLGLEILQQKNAVLTQVTLNKPFKYDDSRRKSVCGMAPIIPKEFQSPPSVCQPSMDMEPPLPNEFQCQPPTVQICLEGVSWYQVDR